MFKEIKRIFWQKRESDVSAKINAGRISIRRISWKSDSSHSFLYDHTTTLMWCYIISITHTRWTQLSRHVLTSDGQERLFYWFVFFLSFDIRHNDGDSFDLIFFIILELRRKRGRKGNFFISWREMSKWLTLHSQCKFYEIEGASLQKLIKIYLTSAMSCMCAIRQNTCQNPTHRRFISIPNDYCYEN